MKKTSKQKTSGNPKTPMNRHKALAMGERIETGASEKTKSKKK
jgi:hypothetical protein